MPDCPFSLFALTLSPRERKGKKLKKCEEKWTWGGKERSERGRKRRMIWQMTAAAFFFLPASIWSELRTEL